MTFTTAIYTFLLFCHFPCQANFANLPFPLPSNCTTCQTIGHKHFEPLKRVAIIKNEILRRLGYDSPPSVPLSAPSIPIRLPKAEVGSKAKDNEYELSDILSYSEAPENFTNENIIQFKLAEGSPGKKLSVKSANLLVRVKCAKIKTKSLTKDGRGKSRGKSRKKRRSKMVDLVISTVDATGGAGVKVASVSSKLKKTKWLKLSLPQDLVQQAIDSNNKTLQVYVKCIGCGKRARLILVHKRRKRRRAGNNKSYRLHKRRPMLFLHTSVTTSRRRAKRSTRVRQCGATSGNSCCKSNFMVNFESSEFEWANWIISPKRYRTAFCEGVCSNDNGASPLDSSSSNVTRQCSPVRTRPLRLVYYNGEGAILQGVLPNMIVTQCGCR